MKVKLKENVKVRSLTTEKIYEVINVSRFYGEGKKIGYTLFDDEFNQPYYYDSEFFEVIDNHIDENWVIKIYGENTAFSLLHEKLSYDSFWEDFSNNDEKAIKLMKEVYPEYNELL